VRRRRGFSRAAARHMVTTNLRKIVFSLLYFFHYFSHFFRLAAASSWLKPPLATELCVLSTICRLLVSTKLNLNIQLIFKPQLNFSTHVHICQTYCVIFQLLVVIICWVLSIIFLHFGTIAELRCFMISVSICQYPAVFCKLIFESIHHFVSFFHFGNCRKWGCGRLAAAASGKKMTKHWSVLRLTQVGQKLKKLSKIRLAAAATRKK